MRILISQTGFLGDVILATPSIDVIRSSYPEVQLSFLTTPLAAPLIELDPLVDSVIRFDKRARHRGVRGLLSLASELSGFDRVYSLHRSFRSAFLFRMAGIKERVGFRSAKFSSLYTKTFDERGKSHAVERNLSLFSELPGTKEGQLRLGVPEERNVSALVLERLPKRPFVVLSPGSAWRTKMWHWSRYRRLSSLVADAGFDVVLIGAPSEREVCASVAKDLPVIDLSGETSLPELAFVIHRAKALVCNDSAALHFASALRIPTVAVFCATDPSFGFGPYKNVARVVSASGLYCRPCRRHGSRECPNGTELCMRAVHEDTVFRHLMAVIEEASSERPVTSLERM